MAQKQWYKGAVIYQVLRAVSKLPMAMALVISKVSLIALIILKA